MVFLLCVVWYVMASVLLDVGVRYQLTTKSSFVKGIFLYEVWFLGCFLVCIEWVCNDSCF
ncbi:hypothetical protein VCRA2113O138_280032 [Vibrio crassostreae]|nr:hypothetical protein VCRA2113O138_280032 [Vibrio crassostreae]CAK2917525.1 hypothetical protein VCRA2127O160_280032 [Vibrio crassostreae]CAK3112696.1 hypothetical protein VCRA2113O139_90032 [Vibrio crassostreae]